MYPVLITYYSLPYASPSSSGVGSHEDDESHATKLPPVFTYPSPKASLPLPSHGVGAHRTFQPPKVG